MTGIIKTDQLQGAQSSTITIPSGNNLTIGGAFTSQGIDDNANAVAITIDTSENVLVKKTATNYQTVGVEAKSTGQLWATADQNNPIIAVRKTNDGKIQTFYKDTTEAGSIGNAGARLFINSGNVGLNFAGDGSNQILPSNAGANRDDGITLGTTNVRFKDLYLSGGVFLGGTGSANKLDDYEEGTWTPNFTNKNSSATQGSYTKVGNFVTCTFDLQAGGSNTNVNVTGVPFAMLVGAGQRGGGLATYQNRNSTEVWTVIPVSSSAINLYHGAASRTITASETVIGTFSFFTTS